MDTARFSVRALLVVSAALAACSASKGSSISDTTPSGTDAGTSDASSSSPDASPPTTEPPKKDASSPDAAMGECASETKQTSCVSCCSKAHEDGAGAYLVATIDCMCLPANCEKDCAATLCNADDPKAPDAECGACVTAKNNACAPAIKSACTADPACVAFDACVGASECTTKPN